MMIPRLLLASVLADVHRHCRSKGYEETAGVNNFVPHDCVAAFAMARELTQLGCFDHYLAIAPEGHIYGYFFERLGATVLSIYTDYPPTRCESSDDLARIAGGRVLLIEDDVIGGATLRLVASAIMQHNPQSVALFLGHTKGIQHVKNVPPALHPVYLAEDMLDWKQRPSYEQEFVTFFQPSMSKSGLKPRYRLEDLIRGITDENRHDEIDTGPAVGNEEW